MIFPSSLSKYFNNSGVLSYKPDIREYVPLIVKHLICL